MKIRLVNCRRQIIVVVFYCSKIIRVRRNFNFDPLNVTRRNKFKLQKFTCHYENILFVLDIWNSLPESVNTFKNRLDKFWINQDVVFNHNCELTGTGNLPVCMWCNLKCGQRRFPAPVKSHWILWQTLFSASVTYCVFGKSCWRFVGLIPCLAKLEPGHRPYGSLGQRPLGRVRLGHGSEF